MSTKLREKFVAGEYYHVYNRTVLNIPLFKNEQIAKRLALTFLIANSTNASEIFQYLRNNRKTSFEKITELLEKGEKIVNVICYAIMPDHYHLLLSEKTDNGIYNFIHKTNTSIAKHINIKKNRTGPIFQDRFKAKHVDSNEYLFHLSVYIHLNPLDILLNKKWRENKLNDWKYAKQKLIEYPWSSFNHFITGKYDPLVSGTEILKERFNEKKDYEKFLQGWAQNEDLSLADILKTDPRGRF